MTTRRARRPFLKPLRPSEWDSVTATAEAVFVSDARHRIIAWNRGAEELFGLKAAQVLGERCFQVLRGKDGFRNRFCSEGCPARHMARRGEPIHSFTMLLPGATGDLAAKCSIVVVPESRSSQRAFLHILEAEPARAQHSESLIAAPNQEVGSASPADSQTAPPRHNCSGALTSREVEVLRLLAGGLGTAEIGRGLGVSAFTVRNHIQRVLEKLQAHSRLQAVLVARRDSLI